MAQGALSLEPIEWDYSMRREMQEILPGVFLGGLASAMRKNLPALLECGITHIVCVREAQEARCVRPNFPDQFTYMVVEVADSLTENILRYFPAVKRFIDDALAAGGKILLHGNAGISRSGTLLIAYIMNTHALDYSQALRVVQARRFCVNPNESFASQLIEYEPIYRAQHMTSHIQAQARPDTDRRKRGYVEDDADDAGTMMQEDGGRAFGGHFYGDGGEMLAAEAAAFAAAAEAAGAAGEDRHRMGARPAPHHPGLAAEAAAAAAAAAALAAYQQQHHQQQQQHPYGGGSGLS